MNVARKIPLPVLIAAGFLLALFIRLMLIPNPGFEADVSFWKSWGLAVRDFGIVKGLPITNFNYPTPFGYFLSLMASAYALFADPHDFNRYWQNNNLLFLFISKVPAILADFGVAGVFLWIGRNPRKFSFPQFPFVFYALLSLVFLFNPIAVMDGAWWGQLDSLGVLLFLLALLTLLRKHPFWAGVVYMVAMMTKLQNMIYGPIFFLFVWQLTGLPGLIRAAGGALVTFAGTNIEFILARSFNRVIESLTGNYDYFPWLSLNAFNPWWIYSGGHGMKGSDKILAVGLASAKNVGLYIFTGGYLLAVLHMLTDWFRQGSARLHKFRADRTSELTVQENFAASDASDLLYRFFTAFMVVNGSFFLFQTESHDRYAFPFIIMLLLWLPFFLWRSLTVKERGRVFAARLLRQFFIIYGAFTILYYYNVHFALIINYPQNGFPVPVSPIATILVSYLFTGAFLWFLLWISRSSVISLIPPVALIALFLIAKNVPLILRRPVYISSLTPTEYKQDYGGRQIDMPVNASLGIKNWSTLSVQYAFYRHGIGTHANSYQVFDIGGLFKKFTFDYGIDTEAGPKGTAVFEVWGSPTGMWTNEGWPTEESARRGDWRKLFASEKIGRYELPRHAEVDVTGIRMLKLVVTDAGDGIQDDHADWLNPLLYQ